MPSRKAFEGYTTLFPTLLLGVSQSHRVVQEEIFGPVLAVQTFRTTSEGIAKANNTPYGLSGGVWTDKGAKAFRVTGQIRAGRLDGVLDDPIGQQPPDAHHEGHDTGKDDETGRAQYAAPLSLLRAAHDGGLSTR